LLRSLVSDIGGGYRSKSIQFTTGQNGQRRLGIMKKFAMSIEIMPGREISRETTTGSDA
jgi:hypothetical protein